MSFKDLVLIDHEGNRYRLVLLKDEPQVMPATIVPKPVSQIDDMLDFKSKLKKRRVAEQITQNQLAVASGIKQSNIAAIENGTREARDNTKEKIILGWEKLTDKKW